MKKFWEYISIRAEHALPTKRVMSLAMIFLAGFHLFLLFIFLGFQIFPMAVVDLVCVLLYVYCYCQLQNERKSLLFIFNLSYGAILLHAVIAVFLIGTNSGFRLYLIAMMPLGYYAAYNFNSRKQAVNPMLYVMLSVMAFVILQVISSYIAPVYSYGNPMIDRVIFSINYVVAVIFIVGFFSTLLNQIRILEDLREKQNKRLENLSKTDALTGLSNRWSVQERYSQSEVLMEGYSLILGDIDDFKAVNDTYGHNIGDEVLKGVAGAFKSAVRDGDAVCRWGGEEFLVFLPKCSKKDARYTAQRILENVRKMKTKSEEGEFFKVTMTLGVASYQEAEEFSEVVRIADERLYDGKQNGKNQVV